MSNPSRGFGATTLHRRSGEQAETHTAGLSTAGQLLVWSMRRWAMAMSCGQAPELALARPYIALRCGDAVPLLDESLTLLSATARRRLVMRCLPHPTLSADERLLLQVMRALQRGAAGTHAGGRADAAAARPHVLPAGRRIHARAAPMPS